jgi:cytochrome b6-f complex iron-sulfur subunit
MRHSLPVLPENLSPAAEVAPAALSSAAELSRRTFLSASSAAVLSCLLVQACGEGSTGPGKGGVVDPPPTGSTSFSNGVVTLQLGLLPALTATNGHQVLGLADGARRADLVVINVGNTFRAFTSICTHEGCTVSGYSNQRMICPCHGSQFNQSGQPVAGPAPTSLREFTVTLNATAQTLTIPV